MIELTVSEPTAIELEVVEGKIKPEVAGHVTPKYSAQTVYPAAGTVFGSVEVDAIPDPTAVKEIGSNGDHDVRRYGTARVDVQPKLQHREATPNRQTQNIEAEAGFDGLSGVTVNPIPSQYIIPEGSLNITQNENGIDVTDKASVNVNVPIPPEYIIPTGTKQITQNGTGINVREFERVDVDVSDKPTKGVVFGDFDNDGYPTTLEIIGYTAIESNFCARGANARPEIFKNVENLILSNEITSINASAFVGFSNLDIVNIPASVITINDYAFRGAAARQVIINAQGTRWFYPFYGANIKAFVFRFNVSNLLNLLDGVNSVELYDFSNNSAVCPLASVATLRHAEGCVIRVPQSLLAEWQAATNWNALTGVVWEGV